MKSIKSKKQIRHYFSGFTLAEILITLSIIGVIASMTIPSLVQDVQDAQFKAAYKKAYADLSQVTSRVIRENGGSLRGICPQSNPGGDICWISKFKPYLNVTKECESGKNIGNCWPDVGGSRGAKYLDGNDYPAYNNWWNVNTGLILNSGMLLAFTGSSGGICDKNYTPISRCFHLWVDVNGFKGPNTFGKDVFYLQVNANRLYPNLENDATCTGTGFGCAARYLYQ